MKRNFARNFTLYGLSTLLVVTTMAVLNAFGLSSQFLTVYMPLAFFTVAGLDFYRTQVREGGWSEVPVCKYPASEGVRFKSWFGFPSTNPVPQRRYADRFIGYLFVAPFIFPARVYELVRVR